MKTKCTRRIFHRVLAMLSAALVVLTTASLLLSASGGGKIDGFSGNVWLEDTYSLGQSGSTLFSGDDEGPHMIKVRPGDEIRIPLTADMFTWSDDRLPLPHQAVTLSELSRGKVTVRTHKQAGGDALDYVQLETDMFAGKPFFAPGSSAKTGRTSYISVMFAEELVSVKEVEFEFTIYVAVNGKTDDSLRIELRGIIENETTLSTEYTDYIDISDGTVLEAEDYARSVKINAGHGVTIDRMLLKNKKYYATSVVKSPSDPGYEEDFPEVYPTVVAAYKLNTVNMRYGKSNVKIDTQEDNYYVYNEKMEYIGMSQETLRYSDYYFLSTKEIPTFEKEEYLTTMSRGPSYKKDYESGESGETEYLAAEEVATNPNAKPAQSVNKEEPKPELNVKNYVPEEGKSIFQDESGMDRSSNLVLAALSEARATGSLGRKY